MRVAPEQINNRLATVKFLNGSDLGSFEELRLEIEGLREADEHIPIPEANEPHAWSRLFKIYKTLSQRRDRQAASDAQQASTTGAIELAWNHFMAERAAFLEWLQREPISDDVKEYIGLQPDDLGPVVIEGEDAARFGNPRRPDWRELAGRVQTAFWKLRNMSVLEKARVPDIMAGRRLAHTVAEHEERLKAVEEKLKAQVVSPPDTVGMTLVGLRH